MSQSFSQVPDTVSGLDVARGVVAAGRIDRALRRLHLDLLEQGADAAQLGDWLWSTHWFPHLNWHEDIVQLAEGLPEDWRSGQICDPQILLQFPHTGPVPEITFHTDQEPDWAGGRRYLRIVGIPLSPWRRDNGGLLVEHEGEAVAVDADPGDAIRMDPGLRHSGGVNLTGALRYGVYFRWLEAAG